MSPSLLVAKSALRNPLRTFLTALGVGTAITAFLVLRTLIAGWYGAAESSASDRMVVRSKISITTLLPLAYAEKARNLVGDRGTVSFQNWFRGVYSKDEKGFFPSFAADDNILAVYPEAVVPAEQLQAWQQDRQGALVGRKLAEKYGWKIGDRVVLRGTIYPGDWELVVRGIYDSSSRAFEPSSLYVHWKLVNERVIERRRDRIGMLLVRVNDSAQASAIAAAIDRTFANSLAETRTESEKAYQLEFLSMVSAVIAAIRVVSLVVLLILTLILANTMAMSTRERTVEYAVLRAIGFRPGYVVGMVLGEGLLVSALGVAIGVALALPVIAVFARGFAKQIGGSLMTFTLQGSAVAMAATAALALGMLAAALPAWRAGRLPIVDALRRVE